MFYGVWLNIYLFPTLCRHWAPRWCLARLRNLPKFTPGGSAASRSSEQNIPYRCSVLLRQKLILWDHGAWAHLFILVYNLAGCWTTVRNTQDMSGFPVRGGWPSAVLMWTSFVSNAWVSDMPFSRPRIVLNVAYPSQAAKEHDYHRVVEWQLMCTAGYTAFAATVDSLVGLDLVYRGWW